MGLRSSTLHPVKEAQEKDKVCQMLREYCMNGWPSKSRLSLDVSPFWQYRGSLSHCKGFLLYGARLLIPGSLRKEMLKRLHEGHQGIGRCRQRAKEAVWWPGLSSELRRVVNDCVVCAKVRQQNAEPLMPTVTPSLPWQMVGLDLFHLRGKEYLLCVDYRSRFPEIAYLSSTKAEAVIERLKSIFARHGIPATVVSDNGPQFSCDAFAEFARNYGFQHTTSSPRHPQANGEAERTVQTMKSLLEKAEDPYLALLAYRDTPGSTGRSPAELLMGRRLRTRIPVYPALLIPGQVNNNVATRRDRQVKERQRAHFDRRHAARRLPKLSTGSTVWVKDLKCPGEVLRQADTPRSYWVRTTRGDVRRNRRALNRIPAHSGQRDELLLWPANTTAPGGSALPGEHCSRLRSRSHQRRTAESLWQ